MNEGKNVQDLANVMMKDYAFYMRKTDGSDYNEAVIKTMWNSAVKSCRKWILENSESISILLKTLNFKRLGKQEIRNEES
jgi:hypothetical protein